MTATLDLAAIRQRYAAGATTPADVTALIAEVEGLYTIEADLVAALSAEAAALKSAREGCRRLREAKEAEAVKFHALLTTRYHQLAQMEAVAEAIRADLWDRDGDPRGHSYWVRLMEVLTPIGAEDLGDIGDAWWVVP